MSDRTLRSTVPARVGGAWLAWVGVAVVSLVVGWSVVARWFGSETALWWALLAGVVAFAVLGYVGALLDRNRPVGDDVARPAPYPTFGVANALTTGRGLALAALAGLFAVPEPGWLPAVLYGSVVVLDALDGVVARARGRTSALGIRLDTAVDAAGLLLAGGLAVALGALPIWFLAVGVARYWYVAGLWWRRRRDRPVGALPPSRVRRPLAALAMVVTSLALVPPLASPATTLVAAVTTATFVAGFYRDWRAVTGPSVKPSANEHTV